MFCTHMHNICKKMKKRKKKNSKDFNEDFELAIETERNPFTFE